VDGHGLATADVDGGGRPPDATADLLQGGRGQEHPAFALGIQDNWVTQLVLYALAATVVFGPDKEIFSNQSNPAKVLAGMDHDYKSGS
jgi:hypothetical protein